MIPLYNGSCVSNNVTVSGIEITKYNYFSNKLMATGTTVFAEKNIELLFYFIDFADIAFIVKIYIYL